MASSGNLKLGLRLLCSFALLTGVALGGSEDGGTSVSPVSLETMVRAQQLRVDARTAAEKGDFLTAAKLLEDAATATGNDRVAEQARSERSKIETGGGSLMFSDDLINLIQDNTAPPARWFEVDQEGGRITEFSQGVFVGSPALMATISMSLDDSRLLSAAAIARTANPNVDVNVASEMRLISLNRLEKHVQTLLEQGKEIPADVLNMAGVSEVRYLFVFPETGDVVIGGPAGKWTADDSGRNISETIHRPTLQLDDLVTLTRTFSRDGSGFFMCSIDPKQGQVKALNDYVSKNRSDLSARTAQAWANKLEETLGMQNVIVKGLPFDSRIASVIVDADYRMKQIGIGEREGVSGMKSYFDILTRSERRQGGSTEALRWWMTVGYDSIEVSADKTAFEFNGRAVQCQSENQILKADGEREATGRADRPNAEFARLFTEHLPALAAEDMVFADLQNIFDLALVSALLDSNRIHRGANWKPETFSSTGDFATAQVDVPKELMTAAASRVYSGGDVVIQVAGGVRGDLKSVVRDGKVFVTSEDVEADALKANPIGHDASRWWWDAAQR
ncbi:MAG: DUF1598 domain-containing protein [Planctomyces sp.]|nr:DUF1598 domain-containing protein [Planctomyces sp.]